MQSDVLTFTHFLPDGMHEGHDGISHELQLRLEVGVVGGEALAAARARVLRVVRRARAARVPAAEVVLPELWTQTINVSKDLSRLYCTRFI